MGIDKIESVELVLFNHPSGIVSGCAKCRKILSEGTWAVGVKIGRHKYVVGKLPKPVCCDKEKSVMQTCASQKEAEELRNKVSEQLKIDGTTENLLLLEPHPVVSAAIH